MTKLTAIFQLGRRFMSGSIHADGKYGGWLVAGALVAVLAGLQSSCRNSGGGLPENAETVTIVRERLMIGYEETGILQATKSMAVQSQVFGKIEKMLPEGELVEKDQPVVWLEHDQLDQALKEERIKVKKNKNDLDQRLESLKETEYNLKKSMEELRLTWEFDTFQVEVAEKEVATRKNQLLDKLIPQSDLEAAEQELLAKKLKLEVSTIALEKAQKQLASTTETMKVDVEIAEKLYELTTYQLKRIEEELEKSVLKAPMSGIVIHGVTWEGKKIKVGDQAYYGVKIIEIPDLREMEVKSQISESYFRELKIGQEVLVRAPALNNMECNGKIAAIKPIAIPRKESIGAGFVSDGKDSTIKVIETDIAISQTDSRLRPGMNVSVIYIKKRLDDVITAPLSALAVTDGQSYVWVREKGGFRKRIVEIGDRNQKKAVILSGLEVGEEAALDNPGDPQSNSPRWDGRESGKVAADSSDTIRIDDGDGR